MAIGHDEALYCFPKGPGRASLYGKSRLKCSTTVIQLAPVGLKSKTCCCNTALDYIRSTGTSFVCRLLRTVNQLTVSGTAVSLGQCNRMSGQKNGFLAHGSEGRQGLR